MNKKLKIILHEPLLLVALPISLISLIFIIILRPFIRVRVGFLRCDRMGHFAANTELYLCERDAKGESGKTLDLFYYPRKVCNQQLATMWERKLIVLPWFWLRPLCLIFRSFACFSSFRVIESRGGDRDIDNLLDRFPPHLEFTDEEERRGRSELRAMGIPDGARFVCLIVRDGAYLAQHYKGQDNSSHHFRDSNIQNYVLAAEALADRGYYVVRMGAVVNEAMKMDHPMIIDYAAKGMRSDFMDIYLGAMCAFCISTGTGFDAVPYIFRRPIVYVDHVPLGYFFTFCSKVLATTKKHWLRDEGHFMTFREIFESGVGYADSAAYKDVGVDLIESTPEEIAAVVLEMEERLRGVYQATEEDEALQQRFWKMFPANGGLEGETRSNIWHGEIRSRIGADFLHQHKDWLE